MVERVCQPYREVHSAVHNLLTLSAAHGIARAVLVDPYFHLFPPVAEPDMSRGTMSTIHDFMRRTQDIQTLPQVALQLCQLTACPDSTVQEIEALLRLDPVLVARLLHLVNSAYYGLRYPVYDLSKALMVIGTQALRNLVLLDAMKGYFAQSHLGSPLDSSQLWLHSAALGVAAKLLSRRLIGNSGEDAFMAGLLHDIGLLVEAQVAPDEVAQVIPVARETTTDLVTVENQLLGTDHTAVGSVLVATWGLPASVTHAIAQHHTPLTDEHSLDEPATLLHFAHALVNEAGYTDGLGLQEVSSTFVETTIIQHVGDFQVLLEDFSQEMEIAACLYQGERP